MIKKTGYITLHLDNLGVDFEKYTQIHLYKSLKGIKDSYEGNIKDIYKVEIKLTKIKK